MELRTVRVGEGEFAFLVDPDVPLTCCVEPFAPYPLMARGRNGMLIKREVRQLETSVFLSEVCRECPGGLQEKSNTLVITNPLLVGGAVQERWKGYYELAGIVENTSMERLDRRWRIKPVSELPSATAPIPLSERIALIACSFCSQRTQLCEGVVLEAIDGRVGNKPLFVRNLYVQQEIWQNLSALETFV